ncbi:hypothetical protein Tco_0375493 [Tanacetum coccineum]
MIADNEKTDLMEPVLALHTLPNHSANLSKDFCFHFSRAINSISIKLSHSELVDIEKVAVCSSLRSLKTKCTIEFDTSAGNPVKEILLKLNLPDHRILKDGGEGT